MAVCTPRPAPTATAARAALQVMGLGSLDPMRSTASDVFYVPGGVLLFTVAVGCLLASTTSWARALSHAHRRLPAALVWVAGAALVLVALFPTDPPGTAAMSLSASIHRYAAAAVFAAVPLAGWICARSLHEPAARAMRWLVAASALVGALAIAGRLGTAAPRQWQPALQALHDVSGGVERVQLVLLVVVLVIGALLVAPRPPVAGTIRGLAPLPAVQASSTMTG